MEGEVYAAVPGLYTAALLGVVEGMTEFLPVSSTGHLILLVDLIGLRMPPGRAFEIVIQLGAILAICVVYFQRLLALAVSLPSSPRSRRFAATIVLAFAPAAMVGALAHDWIMSVLFRPDVVAIALVTGGVAILAVESRGHVPTFRKVEDVPPRIALMIGIFQCLAMIPGVSRSGATILGALVMRVERAAAAEFSFFLAIPTMLGAAVFDLWKTEGLLDAADLSLIGIGFAAAFVSALIIVRPFVRFVASHGFAPFAWYRIALGTGLLVALGWPA